MGDAFYAFFIFSWLGMQARREEEYMLPSTAVYPLKLPVTLVNLDLSISDYFNNIKKLFHFFCFPRTMETRLVRLVTRSHIIGGWSKGCRKYIFRVRHARCVLRTRKVTKGNDVKLHLKFHLSLNW